MSILIKPIITEKATEDSELNNRFSFFVDNKANKIQIKDAVENAYGVTVDKVRTMNIKPTVKTKYTKTGMVTGKTDALKKAIIQVADGDTIDLYSNL
ncbi:50S ribosomal protein L23 [Flavobacterium sp. CS20]|jgi:large subunit ribosomal protein L23|uniref:50S ribosomal protein L23 n=1 Tax=Flavobacterium sp. CS20 TaxID=2775246 RepID=UPI001B3A0C45|nr:50S ribosomal protein L23 [Flavobacterium sp. CS20]QTY27359.1 50S ribosomal protein L23 [Flavobacterium sp. CS20]